MQRAWDSAAQILGFVAMVLIWFPGGTVFMAVMVPGWKLDGLDWVLSVVMPGYGLIRGLIG